MSTALLDAAWKARQNACCDYSGFAVGAAVEASDGRIYSGCNIENASYGLTICAERVALLKALSEGATTFTKIAVVTAAETLTPPCGPCRQLLWEYTGNIQVIIGNIKKKNTVYLLSDLFPHPFDAGNLTGLANQK